MEVVEVTVTPPDVPLLQVGTSTVLLRYTDEVDGVFHAVLRAKTCQDTSGHILETS